MKYFFLSLFQALIFIVSAQQSKLDLSQPEQQKDFLQYLKTTVSLLNDNSIKEMMKGYDLKNITDSNRVGIANKMIVDTVYMKRLMAHFAFMRQLEEKYEISKFSKDDWNKVAIFGSENGVYFIQNYEELMLRQNRLNSLPGYPSNRTIYYSPDTTSQKKSGNQ